MKLMHIVAAIALLCSTALGQAPARPDDIGSDSRLTWHPRLNPTATVVLEADGTVTVWRSGAPVVVPTGAREPLAVALEQCQNDSGEWVGFYGTWPRPRIGSGTGTRDAHRAAGFSGVSLIGLCDDPSSSDWARIGGILISQAIGRQKDLAFINLTIDSWQDRPCEIVEGGERGAGNFYLENVEVLAIPASRKGQTAKGDAATKWPFKGHGAWRVHAKNVRLLDGVDRGDGLGGATEHVWYWDALQGDSEFVECTARGAGISALYFTSRYQYRLQATPANGPWNERFAFGKLLIDELTVIDCGVLGSFAVNICGGIQDVTIRDPLYRVNLDNPNGPAARWAGGFCQVYVDHKQYELDYTLPVNSQSQPIALGYSMNPPGGALPESAGADAMGLPKDGFGGCRSLTVIGGQYQCANLYPPLFSLRDVKLVTFVEGEAGVLPFKATGIGKTAAFALSGPASQCGPAQEPGQPPGLVPAALGAGWNQQARFVSRRSPSVWFGRASMGSSNGVTVQASELDTWIWRP